MPFYFLLSIFYFLFIYLSLKNTKWGLYLITALLPTYLIRFTVLSIPATLLEGMIVILFVVWLIKLKKEQNLTFNPLKWLKNIYKLRVTDYELQNPIPRPLRLPMVLLLIAATFSAFVSPDLRSALGVWKAYFIEPIMFLLIFVYNIKTTDEIKKVIRCLGLTVLAIGVFALIQKLTGLAIPNPFWADEATRRVTTFFGYPNANALFIAPIILLTIKNLLSDKKLIFQSFNLLILILGISTIIWTKSAGAIIALIVGFIFLLLFYKKTRLVVLLLILILTTTALFSPMVKNEIAKTLVQVSSTHLPLNASDLHIRVQQWRETLAMLSDTPIFGPGLSGYQTLVAPYHQNPHVEIYLYPHNFFLNFWTETGLLGLISIVWILIVFFSLTYSIIKNFKLKIELKLKIKNLKLLTLVNISAMIALLIHGLVDVPYFKNDLAILFWIIVGIIIVLYNIWRGARVVKPRTTR